MYNYSDSRLDTVKTDSWEQSYVSSGICGLLLGGRVIKRMWERCSPTLASLSQSLHLRACGRFIEVKAGQRAGGPLTGLCGQCHLNVLPR